MTRSQRTKGQFAGTEPRQLAAFRALIEDEEPLEPHRQQSNGRRREPRGFFQLREDTGRQQSAAVMSGQTQLSQDHLAQLCTLFHSVLDVYSIADIYQDSGRDFDAAVDAIAHLTSPGHVSNAPGCGSDGPASSWQELPLDLKQAVFSLLSPKDLCHVATVSKDFARRVRRLRAGVTTLLLPSGMQHRNIVAIIGGHVNAHTLNFAKWGSMDMDHATVLALLGAIAEGVALPQREACLTGLILKNWASLTDRIVPHLCTFFSSLRELDLSNCRQLTYIAMQHLGRYHVRDHIDDKAGKGEEDQQEPPPTVSSGQPGEAVWLGEGLNSICIAGCSGVADAGVKALLRGPASTSSLTRLDVSRCPLLTGTALALPPSSVLQELHAHSCGAIASLMLTQPAATGALRILDLHCCDGLTQLELAAPQLTSLNLNACSKLGSLSLRCPLLSLLSAAGCVSLQSLDVARWHCPALTSISLFRARALRGADLAAVLSRTTRVVQLDLTGCCAVGRLALEANVELEVLDVSGCRQLTSLTVPSMRLTELQAVACPALIDLSLTSSHLTRLHLTNCTRLATLNWPRVQPQSQAALAPGPAWAVAGTRDSRGGGGGPSGGNGGRSGVSGRATDGPWPRLDVRVEGCNALPPAVVAALVAARRAVPAG